MFKFKLMLLFAIVLLCVSARAQKSVSDADAGAIKQTALDYIEGWYEGNAERMERALNPELAKRIVQTDPKSGRSRLDRMGAMTLVQRVKQAVAPKPPKINSRRT